jgi:hypothetical protein
MYIAISAQKTGATYQNSVSDYVAYLEKENEENQEGSINQNPQKAYFFNQDQDRVEAHEVIEAIDQNTAKLRKRDPRFYSLIISPSQRELKHLQNDPEKLKKYTREAMKDYSSSFNSLKPESLLFTNISLLEWIVYSTFLHTKHTQTI